MRISRRLTGVRFLTLLAALAAGAIAVSLSFGSSHREAPGTMLDPSADDTDVYAFVAKDAPNDLTLVGELDPVRGPGRRAELLPVRRPRGLLPQRRQHRRRALRRPLPVQVPDDLPEQELGPLRAARA